MISDTIILIPHYNNTLGLIKTLDSINEQHYPNVLVVDDGSIEPPQEADLAFYQGEIRILYCDVNRGIEYALNYGLQHIYELGTYTYVARLDCGDTCVANRFAKQEGFLRENPNIQLLGSYVDFVAKDGRYLYTYKVPLLHKDIHNKMFSKNCFIHPSVMIRLSALSDMGYYPTQYKYAEDYAFFFDMVTRFQTANIDQVLVKCESNQDGISERNRKTQMKSRLHIVRHFALPNIHFLKGFFYTLSLVLMPETMHNKLKTLHYR